MRALTLLMLITGTTTLLPGATRWSDEKDAFAPAVHPELLYVGTFGQQGNQWLAQCIIRRGRVIARSPGGFGVTVDIDDDGSIDVSTSGNPASDEDIPRGFPNGGRSGGYKWGYNQVEANLQLPYLQGPGWELWGWSADQARQSKAQYAPYMADSRIKQVVPMPNRDIIAIGYTDGGNTCLRAHPADINQNLGPLMGVGYDHTGGGGGGKSSWVFHITPRGELKGSMVFRGDALAFAWDEWGRVLVGGQGLIRSGSNGLTPFLDGAGILMASRDWQQMLFKAHAAGKANEGDKVGGATWGVTIDSESGLAAACGWVDGPVQGTLDDAPRHGGGKDAFIAVFRLWTPEDYEAAQAAMKEAGVR